MVIFSDISNNVSVLWPSSDCVSFFYGITFKGNKLSPIIPILWCVCHTESIRCWKQLARWANGLKWPKCWSADLGGKVIFVPSPLQGQKVPVWNNMFFGLFSCYATTGYCCRWKGSVCGQILTLTQQATAAAVPHSSRWQWPAIVTSQTSKSRPKDSKSRIIFSSFWGNQCQKYSKGSKGMSYRSL